MKSCFYIADLASLACAPRLAAYRQRNSSRVDDLFVGLFKSVVRCPEKECSPERGVAWFCNAMLMFSRETAPEGVDECR